MIISSLRLFQFSQARKFFSCRERCENFQPADLIPPGLLASPPCRGSKYFRNFFLGGITSRKFLRKYSRVMRQRKKKKAIAEKRAARPIDIRESSPRVRGARKFESPIRSEIAPITGRFPNSRLSAGRACALSRFIGLSRRDQRDCLDFAAWMRPGTSRGKSNPADETTPGTVKVLGRDRSDGHPRRAIGIPAAPAAS